MPAPFTALGRKPGHFNIEPALVSPEWDWFYNRALVYPLLEGDGAKVWSPTFGIVGTYTNGNWSASQWGRGPIMDGTPFISLSNDGRIEPATTRLTVAFLTVAGTDSDAYAFAHSWTGNSDSNAVGFRFFRAHTAVTNNGPRWRVPQRGNLDVNGAGLWSAGDLILVVGRCSDTHILCDIWNLTTGVKTAEASAAVTETVTGDDSGLGIGAHDSGGSGTLQDDSIFLWYALWPTDFIRNDQLEQLVRDPFGPFQPRVTTSSTGALVDLAGSGPNASAGHGSLEVQLDLSGAGPNASDGKGTLSPVRGISGDGPNAAAGHGSLEVQLDLSGAGASASDGKGTLSPVRGISGDGPNASAGSGALNIRRDLTGAGANTSDGEGTVSIAGLIDLSGAGASSSDGKGTVSPVRGISGDGPNASAGSGALNVRRDLSGAGANTSDGNGVLLPTRGLSGTGPSASDGKGTIHATRQLVGVGSAAAAGFAELAALRALNGAGAGASQGSGTVTVTSAAAFQVEAGSRTVLALAAGGDLAGGAEAGGAPLVLIEGG